ncbi:hypothetical protein HMSSN036_22450 [Paenibacillus macerans]|nr:hypothetical protein HMSSN036_22450 [Paenibacillus macerans]
MEASEAAADEVYYKHKLEWLDEQAEVYYSIYDNPGSTLSKSEFTPHRREHGEIIFSRCPFSSGSGVIQVNKIKCLTGRKETYP